MRMLVALVGALLSLNLFAADAAKYLEGKDYYLLNDPVPTLDPSKIEVTEVFSYTCPHCFRFEPVIEAWQKKLPADVVLVQLHTQWSESMKSFQRGYYTATTLKIKDKVQMAVFNAVHKDGKPPVTAEEWAALFSAYGVSKQSVLSTYDSFVVSGMMGQADARARAFKISSTPELVVDGKYRISTPSGMPEADAHQEMVKIASFLVEQVRAERAAKH